MVARSATPSRSRRRRKRSAPCRTSRRDALISTIQGEAPMSNKSWFPTWDRNREVDHFRGFKTQVDSLFEDWFGRSMGGVLAPRVDVAEDDKSVTLAAELPGVDEKDIDVSLVGDQLTIKGEKKSEHEDEKNMEGQVV